MHGPTCIFWANLTPFPLESERLAVVVLGGADFWNLSPVDPDDTIWAAYQLHSVASNSGFVIAFRRIKAVAAAAAFPLVGLLPSTEYALAWSFNYTVARRTAATGVALLGDDEGRGGLQIELPSLASSVLVEYCAAQDGL
jgi:hypothetical protein